MIKLVRSLDNGKALIVDVSPKSGGTSVRLLAPRDFLDDQVGDDASPDERLAYLQAHEDDVASVAEAVKRGNGSIRVPFTKITPYKD